ncbi:hypothetical protein [Neptunomonas japonica]|uniref:Ca-activated chloride channel homolog n=1 Tax=Neptunomonas japonica JAMM 1380 TaxID=1441457 RepID=A0A7R6SX60_9GAMM|nr:hypothetical protein [Neptunomonas japonica]BBB30495.1 Ca-activated chloride channel homolog [Neptunomonas japonica JAMM 1380]
MVKLKPMQKYWGVCLLVLALLWLAEGAPLGLNLVGTADQQGAYYYEKQEFLTSASRFNSRDWRAASHYAAGQYERAAMIYGRMNSADGFYNQGNALAQMAYYEVSALAYRKALVLKPDWHQAQENLALVLVLAHKPQSDQERKAGEKARLEADKLVFDLDKEQAKKAEEFQPDDIYGGLSKDQIEQLWLKRLNVDPADFLRLKFAYQWQREQIKGEQ